LAAKRTPALQEPDAEDKEPGHDRTLQSTYARKLLRSDVTLDWRPVVGLAWEIFTEVFTANGRKKPTGHSRRWMKL